MDGILVFKETNGLRNKKCAIPLIFMVCAIALPLWLLAINMKGKKGRVPLFGIRHWHRGIWLSGVHDTAVWISPPNRNHIFKKTLTMGQCHERKIHRGCREKSSSAFPKNWKIFSYHISQLKIILLYLDSFMKKSPLWRLFWAIHLYFSC